MPSDVRLAFACSFPPVGPNSNEHRYGHDLRRWLVVTFLYLVFAVLILSQQAKAAVEFAGYTSANYNAGSGSVYILAKVINNGAAALTGPLRTELWFTTAPHTGSDADAVVAYRQAISSSTSIPRGQYFN